MTEPRDTGAPGAHAAGEHGAAELHHEPLPVSVYVGVAAALFVLTGVTVGIAQFHFGEWNIVVAMLVASIKASLVVLYFMNLKYDHDRLNRVVFLAALLFLVLYATFTLADHFTRGAVDATRGEAAPITARFAAPAAPTGQGAEEAPAAPPVAPTGTQPGHMAQPGGVEGDRPAPPAAPGTP